MIYESQSANGGDPFDTIVAGMSVSTLALMDGKRVILDPEAGIDFQAEMFEAQANALSVADFRDEPLDEKTAFHLDRVIEKVLQKSHSPIRLDALVAIGGNGIYLTGTGTVEDELDARILTPEERLFGTLHGVGYNSYPFAPLTEFPPDYDGTIDVVSRDGLVMVLGSAMLCTTEGYGALREQFEYTFVPITEPDIIPYAADVLD